MNRPSIPVNVTRNLWFESCGHCMNPCCDCDFFENDCSEKAHIKALKEEGDTSYENMILLCGNCHSQFDANPSAWSPDTLREWKKTNRDNINLLYAKKASDFESLKDMVSPILKKNEKIFVNYGPNTDATDTLWKKFEHEIIANNGKIGLILHKNKKLLHIECQEIIDEFILHTQEFVKTRGDDTETRRVLFPKKLLSIFGLAEIDGGLIEDVWPLQNFIKHLQQQDRYIDINLTVYPPVLICLDETGRAIQLKLTDRLNLKQIFFKNYFFHPKNNSLKLDGLIFFLNWLHGKFIKFKFHKFPDLSCLMLNETHEIQLFYEYTVSINDLHGKESEGLICVNLHEWNGGPYTADAKTYAVSFNMETFNQNEFFIFAHKNIKC